jgi:hypothetical protein
MAVELPDGPDATDFRRGVQVDLASIDRERKIRGWAKQELARHAGLKPGTITEVYRLGSASIQTFAKIARAFEAHPPIVGASKLLPSADSEAGAA